MVANQFAGQAVQAAASLSPIPRPGIFVGGGFLLISPDAVFNQTSPIWVGSVPFSSVQLPVPTSAVGLDLFLEGAAIDIPTGSVNNTNRVRTSILP